MKMAQDLLTGEEFQKSRINQKFARPQNRIAFHNKCSNELRHKLSYIEKPLRKNYIIVNELLGEKNEGVFHKEFLKGNGFNFLFFTHYSTHQEKGYPTIYEFAFIPVDEHKIKIVRNE